MFHAYAYPEGACLTVEDSKNKDLLCTFPECPGRYRFVLKRLGKEHNEVGIKVMKREEAHKKGCTNNLPLD